MSQSLNHGVGEGKAPLELLFGSMFEALEEVARTKAYSLDKYEEDNYLLDINTEFHDKWYRENLSSILRHAGAMRSNDKRDVESDCMHSAHLALRALKAVVYDLRKEAKCSQ